MTIIRRLRPSTAVGLALALALPTAFAIAITPRLNEWGGRGIAAPLIGMAVLWALAAAILVIVRRGERRPVSSIGVQRPTARSVVVGILAGVVLMLLVPALSVIAGALAPATAGGVEQVAAQPWALMLAAVITAAVTEEILFRGYAIERVLELTGSRVAAVAIPVVFFTLTHAGSWNLAHVIGVVLPLGIALSLLYLWRRNLLVVVIAHLVVDLPLVLISALGS